VVKGYKGGKDDRQVEGNLKKMRKIGIFKRGREVRGGA